MTDDLISRQRTVDALETVGYDFSESELSEVELEEVCGAVSDVRQDMIDMIKQLPPAQPEQLGTNLAEVGTDCISRQAAIDATWEEPSYTDPLNVLTEVRDRIEALPSAQPERIRGRWIYTGVKFPNWEGQVVSEAICSECNGISYFRRAFDKYIGANICPNCGADMRGEQDD